MKIQIEAQGIRLRVSEAELSTLLADGELQDTTLFSVGFVHVRCLRLIEGGEAGVEALPGKLTVILPRAEFLAFAAERPRRDGMTIKWTQTGGEPLAVSVEVDVRDSHRQGVKRSI